MKSQLPKDHPFSDFRVLLCALWEFLGLPEPTAIQLDMAYHLQHGGSREILEAFRGVGKSWITCAFVCWLLLHDPELKIEIISAGETLAIDNATFIAQLIREVPFLQHLRPSVTQRSSKLSFDVGPATASPSPSVKAAGILGQITGTRADYIIADDIEIPKNSDSQGQRDKIRQLVTEFESILKPEGGRIIYLGTPQLADTLYANLPDNYNIRVYPAEFPTITRCNQDSHKLAPMVYNAVMREHSLIGQPTEPKRFPEEVLMEKKAGMGLSNYELQMMLNTDASDAFKYPLKFSDMIVMDLDNHEGHEKVYYSSHRDEELKDVPMVGLRGDRFYGALKVSQYLSKYERVVLAIDPSGRGKDETAYVVLGQLNAQLFLLEWGGHAGGYSEDTLDYLASLAKKFRITDCVIESNFGDGMFSTLFQPYLNRLDVGRAAIEDVHVSSQKEVRIIDTLEPVLNQHRLVVNKRLIQQDYDSVSEHPIDIAYRYRGFYQLAHLTRDKGSLGADDRIDVLQLGVKHLLDNMIVDQTRAVESQEMKRAQTTMKYWVNEFGSSSSQSRQKTTWLD